METTRDDDFTFSKVVPPDGENVLEAKDLASNVGSITLKDGLDQQSNGLLWRDKSLPPKEETVGSLSFRVIDSSSSKKQSNEPSENFKVPARKPITRKKVPLEKGHSPMDWLKLTRTHPDLAGLKGESNKRLISMDEVKKHRSGDLMWTVLQGRVYNISPYLNFHPGGVDMLMKAVGRDEPEFQIHQVTELAFFATKVRLGRPGAEEVYQLGPLNEYESIGLEKAKEELAGSIQKGVEFIRK